MGIGKGSGGRVGIGKGSGGRAAPGAENSARQNGMWKFCGWRHLACPTCPPSPRLTGSQDRLTPHPPQPCPWYPRAPPPAPQYEAQPFARHGWGGVPFDLTLCIEKDKDSMCLQVGPWGVG